MPHIDLVFFGEGEHDGEAAPIFAWFVVGFVVEGEPGVAGDFAVWFAVDEAGPEVNLEGQPGAAKEVVAGQGAAHTDTKGGATVEKNGQIGKVAGGIFGLGGRPFGGDGAVQLFDGDG
jgi:hypothetical protein